MTALFFVILINTQTDELYYLQNQLTVEIENTTIASYSDWDYFMKSMRFGGGNLAIKRERKWDCYQGGLKISESDFYATAGLPDYAFGAHKYKDQRDFCIIGGVSLGIIGLGIMGYELARWQLSENYPMEEINNTVEIIGLGIASVGITLELMGTTRPPKFTSVKFAVGVADQYNKTLHK